MIRTMRKNIAIIILNFASIILSAQTSSNLEDLSPLKNATIVLLGEQTHFDGAVIDKKVQLIKQLHQQLGFNIVAFESGLYDNYKAQQLYQTKKESIAIFNQSIFAMVTETAAFKDLLDYIELHPEMKILGFDNQESSLFKEYFIPDLKKLLSKNSISLPNDVYVIIEKTMIFRDLNKYVNNKKDSLELYQTFNNINSQIEKIKNKDLDAQMIQQTFKSAVSDIDFELKMAQKEKIKIQNPRDKQMAENLIFLQQQFPNEKIIGWGASYHFANNINEFEYTATTEDYIKQLNKQTEGLTTLNYSTLEEQISSIKELSYAITMGKLLKKHYQDKIYSIAFTSYNGTYYGKNNTELTVLEPPKNSIEELHHSKNSVASLVDKSSFPKERFYVSALGYLPLYANWNTIFDGIYYIPTMYPPTFRDYDETISTTFIAQESNVNGVILNSDSNSPISYVDVYYSSNNKSSITNNNGQFNITKSKNPDDYIVFSTFGYTSDSIQVKAIPPNKPLRIKLKVTENIEALDEVILKNTKALTATEILKKAKKKIKENYIQTPFNQTFFYKVQQYKKDSLILNEAALIDTYFKKGNSGTNNPENNIYGNISQLRNTTNNYSSDKLKGVGNLWVTIIRDIILSKANVLYHTGSYDLTKESSIDYDGKTVYQISFTNNSPGSFSTGYGYPAPLASSGVIYIDTESFAVLYYEHCVEREKNKPKRSDYTSKRYHKIVQSYKEVNGKYFINSYKVIDKYDVYTEIDDTFLYSSYVINNLLSTDIEIQNVKTFIRPLRDIKQKITLDTETVFWQQNSFYIEDNSYTFEDCK